MPERHISQNECDPRSIAKEPGLWPILLQDLLDRSIVALARALLVIVDLSASEAFVQLLRHERSLLF
jgi:hypothetical protein